MHKESIKLNFNTMKMGKCAVKMFSLCFSVGEQYEKHRTLSVVGPPEPGDSVDQLQHQCAEL